jgi:hypothetical protein
VLTGPNVIAGSRAGLIEASRLTITSDMVPVSLEHTAESVTRSHENGPPDSASEVHSGKHAQV